VPKLYYGADGRTSPGTDKTGSARTLITGDTSRKLESYYASKKWITLFISADITG
jgi:hypothetical protein